MKEYDTLDTESIFKTDYLNVAKNFIFSLKPKNKPGVESQTNLSSQKKRAKNKQKKRLIPIDALTNLPTRLMLIDDIKNTPATKSNHAHTLLYIQIEGYEDVNEFFGIDTGYTLLKEIANWLSENLPSKNAKLYKFEHNAFAIYNKGRFSLSDLEEYLKTLHTKIHKTTIKVDDTSYDIAFSIGVARGRGEDLLKHSYLALKESIKKNKPYMIFNKKNLSEEQFLNNIKKNREIREALQEDRIVPFFQPILNIKTNKVEKFESLMRIQNRDNTHQTPAEFLEVAKRSKLYPEMTKAMIKASFKRIELLSQPTTINISIEDIINPKIASFILRRLEKFEHCDILTFEILESEEITNHKKVANFIKKIKSFGCKVAIDDFGSGYSNFEQILKLDIDYIKIDGSLIKNILNSKENEIVAKTIINFAKELGVKTIAEFVSSEEIFQRVKHLGIDYAQGYYIGKPSPIAVV